MRTTGSLSLAAPEYAVISTGGPLLGPKIPLDTSCSSCSGRREQRVSPRSPLIGPMLLRRSPLAELNVRQSPAHLSHAPADCRAAISAAIRTASAPTPPIDVEGGAAVLIPAK